jgi:hypothetical protein
MSMEIHVLFRGKLPTKPALVRAMKELGFPITIPPPKDSLEKQEGFLPMRLCGKEAGAEFDVFDGRAAVAEVMNDYGVEVDPSFDRCASFRWGGNENEMMTAICASATLAKLVGGAVLDCASGELMSVNDAIAWAKGYRDRWVETNVEAANPKGKRFGTRPTDLKRYLKPLLKLRDDLVLVDGLLLIRPVRHLIRGVYFEPRGKYSFQLWNYVNPLYAPADEPYGDSMRGADVREPHFQPLLIDTLAEDVFAKLGQITTITDYAAQSFGLTYFFAAKIVSLALAGDQDRAAEYAAQIQEDEGLDARAKNMVQEQWERVSRDIQAGCEEFRAKEVATVKALGLEHVWEPLPFPVELPEAERAPVSEPAFSTTPWISRPEWLFAVMPDQPSELRFGKEIRERNGRDLLVAPLTREDAQNRHHAGEAYAMAERLADGSLLTLRRPGLHLQDPENPDARRYLTLRIKWETSSHVLRSRPSQAFDDEPNTIAWWMFSVRDRVTQKEIWLSYVDPKEGKVSIHDSRSGERSYSNREIAAAERESAICPMPDFGDNTELLARIRTLLDITGYGPWP